MPRLPVELYREIVQHVTSKSALCALCISSKILQMEAEFFIYQTIESTAPKHTEGICHLFISTSRVRPFVRHLEIRRTSNGSVEFWQLVARALEVLPNLQALRIFDATTTTNSNAWILPKSSFVLREFQCNFAMDTHLVSFLESQSALEELKWVDNQVDLANERPQALNFSPKLRKLTTTASAFALQMMGSHTLTHVYVGAPSGLDVESWMSFIDGMGNTAHHLRSLRLHFPYDKRTLAAVLDSLASKASEIRSLGFVPCFNANVSRISYRSHFNLT